MPEDQKESKANPASESPATDKVDESTAKEPSADAKAAAKAAEEAKAAVRAEGEAEVAAKAAEEAEAAAKIAIAKAEAAKDAAKAATEAAVKAEYQAIANKIKSESAASSDYTFKRQNEEIFRREMGEPEFFLHKKDRFPLPVLSQEQQDELTRKVEIPVDNTPKYVPKHVLSPEFGGVSHYESEVRNFLEESRVRLEKLKNDPDVTAKELSNAKHDVSYLESLHENYFLGMNVFRTAKGGRSKLQAK